MDRESAKRRRSPLRRATFLRAVPWLGIAAVIVSLMRSYGKAPVLHSYFSSGTSTPGVEAPQGRRQTWQESARRGRQSDTALVFVDTRPFNPDVFNYESLAMMTNLRYAHKYGYDVLFYQLRDKSYDDILCAKLQGICYHPLDGWRSAAWCKLVITRHALVDEGYKWVVYMDTDAYFNHQNQTLLEHLSHFVPPKELEERSIFFFEDAPYCPGRPNAGIIFVKNTPEAVRFLERWWNAESTRFRYNNKGALAEQRILWDQLFVNPAYNRTMYMIPRTVFEPCCGPSLEKPIIHLPGVHALDRLKYIQQQLTRQYLGHAFAEPGETSELENPQDLVEHLRLLNINSSEAALSFSQTVHNYIRGVDVVVDQPDRADEFVYDKKFLKHMSAEDRARLSRNATLGESTLPKA